jgi:outer membrane protein assembly factor BamB
MPRRFQFGLIMSLGLSLYAGDWPYWRGPAHDGVSREKFSSGWPANGPKKLWQAEVGTGFASMAVSAGRAYTSGNQNETDSIYCFDAINGGRKWKHSYPAALDPEFYAGGTSATPTIDGDRVYTFSKGGELFCFAADDGKVLWQKNLRKELNLEVATWGLASSPIIDGNFLLLNAGGGGTAMDKNTGRVLWKSGKEPNGYSSAVFFDRAGSRQVIFALEKGFAGFNEKDGAELWRFPWVTPNDVNAADPVMWGNRIFISSGYGRGCALLEINGNTPNLIYENTNLRSHCNPPVLLNGFLYGFDGNVGESTALVCLEWATGRKMWSEARVGAGALMAADGKLIVLSFKGDLLIVNATPKKFAVESRAHVIDGEGWTVPVLANGKIYCRNSAGNVVCLDASSR